MHGKTGEYLTQFYPSGFLVLADLPHKKFAMKIAIKKRTASRIFSVSIYASLPKTLCLMI